ncbi:beta-alanine-activating enzyme-like [Topomyia yanbarensis]|uniref:beta-alanine-activating enzyme-like n=1 Tax=Topomyia yanbarensis TaxID=2498891 RepID=UPI00273BB200|nr:beta-alanine-activating enzyme-like [Topomyia yanbarensis]XP_058839393.1 beta-alanine-activating enzyme-like [Topomyia yanbarensis]
MLQIEAFNKYATLKAIVYHSKSGRVFYSYSQLCTAATSLKCAIQNLNLIGQCFGVSVVHSPALVAVICGINYSQSAFYCFNAGGSINRVREELKRIGSHHCFCREQDVARFQTNDTRFNIIYNFNLLDEKIQLLHFESRTQTKTACDIAYYIGTSGSTGQPKLVKVPTLCILPNLEQLKNIFQVTQDDRIFVASPASFDPFVVDVFLALRNGACLTLVANEIRLNVERLLTVLFELDKVTIMQITPSLFQRWSEQSISEVILRNGSSLRHLVLGGEPFPVRLKTFEQSSVHVYNIYGITEISCWATIEKVIPGMADREVSLGSPLDRSIELQLRHVDGGKIVDLTEERRTYPVRGQLFIGSRTRKCVVNDEHLEAVLGSEDICYRSTGDLVELRQDGKYYYLGRCDDMIKRFGTRVSLVPLEQMADQCDGIIKSCAVFDGIRHKLALFYRAHDESVNEQSMRQKFKVLLSNETIPDDIIKIDSFPLSNHGKIDRKMLLKQYQERSVQTFSKDSGIRHLFNEQIFKILGISLEKLDQPKRSKPDVRSSFLDAGGTSIQAVQLTTFLQDCSTCPIPNLIGLLLDKAVPLTEVGSYMDETNQSSTTTPAAIKPETLGNRTEICIQTKFDMNKCIDASPTTFHSEGHNRTFLAVGSHSHKIIVVDTQMNQIVSELTLPDRVESAVNYLEDQQHGLVGCYDGFLYCFDIWTSTIRWKFDSGGMIKGKALISGPLIVFGCYADEHNLFALELKGTLAWKLKLGSKGILSSPLAFYNGMAFVATLDGTCSCFVLQDGTQCWCRKLNSPVFADSVYIEHFRVVLVAEVQGVLHCLSSKCGTELWSVSTEGNIFSTPIVLPRHEDSVAILLGCHDKHLYCFNYTINSESATPSWKIRLQSPIYAGSTRLDTDLIVVCSTTGYVNLISLAAVQVISVIKTSGEIFSTPVAIDSETFYVGCRDNFLYKLGIQQPV